VPMKSNAVKWGILSTADINKRLLPGAQESEDVEVLAVGSRDLDRAREFAAKWGIPRAYGSYEELLADPDVEAVYIPLPNTMHCEWSIRAVEAGKHVLCEKPMSRHPADVEAAFDASERTGRLLSEALMYRHNPQTKQLQELVASGVIGELRLIRSTFSYSLFDTSNIRLRTDAEGGSLMDVGCYCVSGSRLLGGEPEVVAGQQFVGPSGTDWVFAGTMRFPRGVLATFDCGTSLPERDELEAVGTEGSLFLDDPWHCLNPVIELRRGGKVERIAVEPVNSYRLELEDLGAAIRGEGMPLLGREEAVQQARVIEALFQSAETGAAIALV
jgi:D-xylose 1-dehydrogenase (NADP+, D-xylono-1,5-lactone-forming)